MYSFDAYKNNSKLLHLYKTANWEVFNQALLALGSLCTFLSFLSIILYSTRDNNIDLYDTFKQVFLNNKSLQAYVLVFVVFNVSLIVRVHMWPAPLN